MFGVLTGTEIAEVLNKNVLGRIGCSENGRTYVVPISYAFADNVVYCRTFEGMKLRMMRANPSVCFEVEDYSNMGNWRSVIAWGTFQEITRFDERAEALKHLSNRHLPVIRSETTHLAQSWPFPPDDINEIEGIVFRIKLNEMSGRFEKYIHR